ncbi:MAG: hypothetical protein M3R24_27405 [Chloroflexota bacterium]|nr:hypothetical protein [Chloroflexota bacterium]
MPILILQKGIVEVVWSKGTRKHGHGVPKVLVYCHPFVRGQVRDRFSVATQHQEALAQEVLVAVKDEAPVGVFG